MQENLVLEKNQKAVYDDVVATYKAKARLNGEVTDEYKELQALKPGIRLHFLRYGVTDYNDENTQTVSFMDPAYETSGTQAIFNAEGTAKKVRVQPPQNNRYSQPREEAVSPTQESIAVDDVEIIDIQEIPNFENFYITRTALQEGYIYLINDADPTNEHHELYVSPFGLLQYIPWAKNKDKNRQYKDIRKPSADSKRFIIVPPETTYRIAFSPVQWSIAYHQQLCSDSALREVRMQEVKCIGFKKGEAPSSIHIQPYHNVCVTVTGTTPFSSAFKDTLDLIEDREAKEDQEGGNDILDDMFITLHDPFSCADEICVSIDNEIKRLQALILSLQTGASVEHIFPYVKEDKQFPIADTVHAKQLLNLHRLAQLAYDFVYNSEEYEDKYDAYHIQSTTVNVALDLTIGEYLRPFIENDGISLEKVEKVLGVTERRAQRDCINTYRDDLGNLMKSAYYQEVCVDYKHSIPDVIEEAKERIAMHTIALGSYPNQYDKHLDLKSVYRPKEDAWYKQINETLYNETPEFFTKSTQLLNYTLDIRDLKVVSLFKRTASIMDKIVKAYANHDEYVGTFSTLNTKVLPITSKLYYFRDKRTRVATIKFRALDDFHEEMQRHNLRLEIEGTPVSLERYKNHWHAKYKKMTKMDAEALIKSGKLEINLKGNLPKRFKTEAERILKSNAFAKVVVAIEIYVWTKAVRKLTKEYTASNAISFAIASVKLAAASLSLVDKMNLYGKHLAGKGLEEQTIKNVIDDFRIKVQKLKIVSSSITVIMASRDAYFSYSVRDTDAAVVYGMAAGIGGVFVAADIAALVGGSTAVFALGFWPAALLGGALIACYYLVDKYCKDTQLEGYFKNFPLSDYALPPNASEHPYQYINRLVAKRQKTVINPWFENAQSRIYKTYSNFEIAYTALQDILLPTIAIVLPAQPENSHFPKGFQSFNARTNRFKAYIYSVQQITHHEDLEIQAWFYPKGIKAHIKSGHRFEITFFSYDFPKPKGYSYDSDQNLPNCVVDFQLPIPFYGDYMDYPDGEVLFLYRIRVKDDEFIPCTFMSKPRYAYGHAQIHNTTNTDIRQISAILPRFGKRTNIRELKLQGMSKEEALQKPKIVADNSITLLESYNPNV